MLNDADGHGSGEASEAVKDADARFRRLKRDVKADYNSKDKFNWRREAREDFDFEAGEQLNERFCRTLSARWSFSIAWERRSIGWRVRKSATGRKCSFCRAGSAWRRKTSC
jgi:hypothetical protein